MLAQQTTDLLHRLKLPAMADALDEQRRMPDVVSLDFEDRLALLLEREHIARENRRLTRLLQLARLRHVASIEDVNFRVKRGFDKSQLLRLASADWIQQHGVLLITGSNRYGEELACVRAWTQRVPPRLHRALSASTTAPAGPRDRSKRWHVRQTARATGQSRFVDP